MLIISDLIKLKQREILNLSVFEVILIGVAQGIAVLPGISRSGFTIMAGLFLGIRRDESAKFSFLMMMPAVTLATLLELVTAPVSASGTLNFFSLLSGMIVAFFSGLLGIKLLMSLVKKAKLKYFGFYLIFLVIFAYFLFQS